MKLIAVILTILAAVNSHALGNRILNMSGCHSTLTVDSGSSAKLGYTAGWDDCDCKYAPMNAGYCFGSVQPGGGSCQWGLTEWGSTIAGGTCCYDASTMCRVENGEIIQTRVDGTQVEVSLETPSELEAVFGMAPQSSSYFGYVNSSNRSPNAGRGNSVFAKLDACLGHANVDADTDMRTCETACQNSLKNQYCQNNNSAVCIDRCECRWGESGCNGL